MSTPDNQSNSKVTYAGQSFAELTHAAHGLSLIEFLSGRPWQPALGAPNHEFLHDCPTPGCTGTLSVSADGDGRDLACSATCAASGQIVMLALYEPMATANGHTFTPPPPAWQKSLLRAGKGQPLAVLANALTALREAPEWAGLLFFDAFHQHARFNGTLPWAERAEARDWNSNDDMLACEWMQREGILVGPEITGQAVETVARDRLFHPVLDYLARCQWDGVPRIDTWLIDHLGVEDTPYARAVGAKWLISAVARVCEPGCKADCALILEGDQGIGKSTALRTLASPWFADELSEFGSKDAALQLAGVWIVELAELTAMKRGDIERVKSFMSRSTDHYRPPYAKRVVDLPRQCVFAGTTNDEAYLRDPTGARRFWPVRCGMIDIAALNAVRDQLWAEACERYRNNESWWIDTRDLEAAAQSEQDARYDGDAWEGPISDYLGSRPSVTVTEILRNALFMNVEHHDQKAQNRVAACLRHFGWRRKQVRTGRKRAWHYVAPSPVSPDSAE